MNEQNSELLMMLQVATRCERPELIGGVKTRIEERNEPVHPELVLAMLDMIQDFTIEVETLKRTQSAMLECAAHQAQMVSGIQKNVAAMEELARRCRAGNLPSGASDEVVRVIKDGLRY